MTLPRRGACQIAVLVLLGAFGALVGCSDAPIAPTAIERDARYGVFRDLVLIPRSDARGGPFFLDRFESTRRDLLAWCAATGRAAPATWPAAWSRHDLAGGGDDVPAARIELPTARAFARWRFCRLPRLPEWEYAATAGGEYRFPWGDPSRAEWANTPQLGLGRVTPVGTFESGRAPAGPYDLVGNVAEWTESLTPRFHRTHGWLGRAAMGAAGAQLPAGAPLPLIVLLAFAPTPAPHLVVGGGFLGMSGFGLRQSPRTPQIPMLEFRAGEWSDDVGVRLATDPEDLLRALLREPEPPPDEASVTALVAFLEATEHRPVLARALEQVRVDESDSGPLAAILVRALLR